MINKRLTEEEVKILTEKIIENYSLPEEVTITEIVSVLDISDIFYLSCLTDISYHKIFSYLMYEYIQKNEKMKKIEAR